MVGRLSIRVKILQGLWRPTRHGTVKLESLFDENAFFEVDLDLQCSLYPTCLKFLSVRL